LGRYFWGVGGYLFRRDFHVVFGISIRFDFSAEFGFEFDVEFEFEFEFGFGFGAASGFELDLDFRSWARPNYGLIGMKPGCTRMFRSSTRSNTMPRFMGMVIAGVRKCMDLVLR
jgi:hypothetical protein